MEFIRSNWCDRNLTKLKKSRSSCRFLRPRGNILQLTNICLEADRRLLCFAFRHAPTTPCFRTALTAEQMMELNGGGILISSARRLLLLMFNYVRDRPPLTGRPTAINVLASRTVFCAYSLIGYKVEAI